MKSLLRNNRSKMVQNGPKWSKIGWTSQIHWAVLEKTFKVWIGLQVFLEVCFRKLLVKSRKQKYYWKFKIQPLYFARKYTFHDTMQSIWTTVFPHIFSELRNQKWKLFQIRKQFKGWYFGNPFKKEVLMIFSSCIPNFKILPMREVDF